MVEEKLRSAVAGTPLEGRLVLHGEALFARRSKELARLDPDAPALPGLARVLGSSADAARYLSLRPELLTRIGLLAEGSLESRAGEVDRSAPAPSGDLEDFLDRLRLFRRDETIYAACADLSGLATFEQISSFLSRVAEAVVESALRAASGSTDDSGEQRLCVLAMGKLAGRELTYHSDLDLIFLVRGEADDVVASSRVSQRLMHYLSIPTGAGVAYQVDARLRPSGGQGALVTSLDSYESYQLERAMPWEHLALMRCRAIAGDSDRGGAVLRRVQDRVRARRARPWAEVARMRERIRAERTRDSGDRVSVKTGAGGLMDVDFLAAGAQLERGGDGDLPELPSVPSMLAGAARGPRVDALLDAYAVLRRIEAHARWAAGRAVDEFRTSPESLALLAALDGSGRSGKALLEQVEAARETVRSACEAVLSEDTIDAIADGAAPPSRT